MSDMFKQALNKGRELAGKALETAGEVADKVGERTQARVADLADGLALSRLEERANALSLELEVDLCIRRFRQTEILWEVSFGLYGEVGTGPDFQTAAEQALMLNPIPVQSDEGYE